MVKKPTESLAAFMRNRARAQCAVCKLSEDLRKQLGPVATRRGFTRADQVEWLRAVVPTAGITLAILAQHLGGRHDDDSEI